MYDIFGLSAEKKLYWYALSEKSNVLFGQVVHIFIEVNIF